MIKINSQMLVPAIIEVQFGTFWHFKFLASTKVSIPFYELHIGCAQTIAGSKPALRGTTGIVNDSKNHGVLKRFPFFQLQRIGIIVERGGRRTTVLYLKAEINLMIVLKVRILGIVILRSSKRSQIVGVLQHCCFHQLVIPSPNRCRRTADTVIHRYRRYLYFFVGKLNIDAVLGVSILVIDDMALIRCIGRMIIERFRLSMGISRPSAAVVVHKLVSTLVAGHVGNCYLLCVREIGFQRPLDLEHITVQQIG